MTKQPISDQVVALAEGWACIVKGHLFGPYLSPGIAKRMLETHRTRLDLEDDVVSASRKATVTGCIIVGCIHGDELEEDYDEMD